eukprot:511548-Prymnesium_polylepis.2
MCRKRLSRRQSGGTDVRCCGAWAALHALSRGPQRLLGTARRCALERLSQPEDSASRREWDLSHRPCARRLAQVGGTGATEGSGLGWGCFERLACCKGRGQETGAGGLAHSFWYLPMLVPRYVCISASCASAYAARLASSVLSRSRSACTRVSSRTCRRAEGRR